jgi:hypothetical protein
MSKNKKAANGNDDVKLDTDVSPDFDYNLTQQMVSELKLNDKKQIDRLLTEMSVFDAVVDTVNIRLGDSNAFANAYLSEALYSQLARIKNAWGRVIEEIYSSYKKQIGEKRAPARAGI